jgi:hypothetical protein
VRLQPTDEGALARAVHALDHHQKSTFLFVFHQLFDSGNLKAERLHELADSSWLIALQLDHPPAHGPPTAAPRPQFLRQGLDGSVRVLRPEPIHNEHRFPTPVSGQTAQNHAPRPDRISHFPATTRGLRDRLKVRQPREL